MGESRGGERACWTFRRQSRWRSCKLLLFLLADFAERRAWPIAGGKPRPGYTRLKHDSMASNAPRRRPLQADISAGAASGLVRHGGFTETEWHCKPAGGGNEGEGVRMQSSPTTGGSACRPIISGAWAPWRSTRMCACLLDPLCLSKVPFIRSKSSENQAFKLESVGRKDPLRVAIRPCWRRAGCPS
ncbi:hypothetical protein ABW21_db0203812 [Orbilia brochopaga]|nr:hypothetical protein ABW21_db0203812 [Drechslerella brochopaga]